MSVLVNKTGLNRALERQSLALHTDELFKHPWCGLSRINEPPPRPRRSTSQGTGHAETLPWTGNSNTTTPCQGGREFECMTCHIHRTTCLPERRTLYLAVQWRPVSPAGIFPKNRKTRILLRILWNLGGRGSYVACSRGDKMSREERRGRRARKWQQQRSPEERVEVGIKFFINVLSVSLPGSSRLSLSSLKLLENKAGCTLWSLLSSLWDWMGWWAVGWGWQVACCPEWCLFFPSPFFPFSTQTWAWRSRKPSCSTDSSPRLSFSHGCSLHLWDCLCLSYATQHDRNRNLYFPILKLHVDP